MLPTLTALLLTVRIALSALLVLLTALAGLLLLLLLLLLFLLVLIVLSALILLITHGTLLTVGVSQGKRGASLHCSSIKLRIILTTFCMAFLAFAAKAEDQNCATTTLGAFDTGSIVDGRSFMLRDGREILLAGIEMPSTGSSQAELEKLLAGGKVVLRQTDPGDRYGRLRAQVFTPTGGGERWIQQELLAAGLAQLSGLAGVCDKALRAAEKKARINGLGIWANSAYSVKASDDFSALAARQGLFTVAEGKVLSVRESAGTIYMNFGRVWSRNLTVTILRRNKAAFVAAGIDPKKFQGSRIRVRGWVEMRNGPRINAARPEQIEVAAQD